MSAVDVIQELGGTRPFARICGFHFATVNHWKRKNRIPQEHWQTIITRARKSGVTVTINELAPPKKGKDHA